MYRRRRGLLSELKIVPGGMSLTKRLPLALRLYQFASAAGSPVAPQVLARRLKRGKEHAERLSERRGEPSLERPPGPLIWVHGASVGEMLAAVPLIERLRAQDFAVLVTSGTVTSAALAEQRLPDGAIHQFIPLDAPRFVERFLAHWKPGLALFVESDLWPNLILSLRRAQNSDDRHQRPLVGALVRPLAARARRDRGAARTFRSVPDAIRRRRRALCRTRRAARELDRQSQARRAAAVGRRGSPQAHARDRSAAGRSSSRPRRIPARKPPSSPRTGVCARNFRRC